MNIDDIPRLTALHEQLKKWREALARAENGSFKSATLVVTGMAHGEKGIDSRPQQAESRLEIPREAVEMFIRQRIEEINGSLRELGVEN